MNDRKSYISTPEKQSLKSIPQMKILKEKAEMTNIKKIFLILSACMLMVITGCASMGVTTIPMDKLKAKYADNETKTIQVDGINVYYKDEGQGPTLILLHGVCASLHTWDGWTERLKDHYRIIRIDIPGFGLTGPAPDRSFYTVKRSVMLMEKSWRR